MAKLGLCQVLISITTLDKSLARKMEARAASPARRLRAIERLANAGSPVGVLASPMIPALNDGELETILKAARDAGATSAATITVRLPHSLRGLFSQWLEDHYPNRKERVLGLIRESHGGRLYRWEFGSRMSGTGPYAALFQQRFRLAKRRLGFSSEHFSLNCQAFVRPANTAVRGRKNARQLPLFS